MASGGPSSGARAGQRRRRWRHATPPQHARQTLQRSLPKRLADSAMRPSPKPRATSPDSARAAPHVRCAPARPAEGLGGAVLAQTAVEHRLDGARLLVGVELFAGDVLDRARRRLVLPSPVRMTTSASVRLSAQGGVTVRSGDRRGGAIAVGGAHDERDDSRRRLIERASASTCSSSSSRTLSGTAMRSSATRVEPVVWRLACRAAPSC